MTGICPAELEFIQSLPGYDPSFEPIHYDEWSDYEESGWLCILRKDGQLYTMQGGHCVMASSDYVDTFSPHPVSEEEALEDMLLFEETCIETGKRMSP